MAVSLQKGQKISLSKEKPGLSEVIVGLGWDEAQPVRKGFFAPKPQSIDCDAFAILLTGGRLTNKDDVVYFGNLRHVSQSVQHMGDNLTGAGEGDDEQIKIDLQRVPDRIDKIVVAVNIYQAVQKRQHFGLIQNAYIRIVDARSNHELCRYNLTDDYSGQTAMLFGEVYKHNGEWKFNAVGQGTTDGSIGDFTKRFL